MREIKSGKYYTTIEDTIKKYNIPEEARENIKETVQVTEDEFLYYTLRLV